MESHHEMTNEDVARFIALYGVSPSDLESKGIDVRQYVHDNTKAAQSHLYDEYRRKAKARQTLLPYWAPAAYISKGRSKVATSWIGSVDVRASIVRLVGEGKTLAEGSTASVTVHSVPLWMGMGTRLDFQGGDRWFVQPFYKPANIAKSHRANRIFRSALKEAGAQS
jgi:hypothetical protein